MLKITIPNNNIEERKYILDIIFDEFLGLKYDLEIKEGQKSYQIKLPNKNTLIIEDHFFNKFPKTFEYLKLKNIPLKVEFASNDLIPEKDIPIIYGTSKLEIKDSNIVCGIDIFASSFFMLTRWEEYVNKNRDKHNRFPATESLAYKQGFLDRPVVNEYVEMLKKMILKLDSSLKFKKHHFKYILTHDVDHPLRYNSLLSGLREITGDIVKRRDTKRAFLNILQKIKVHIGLEKDPFDTFDYLMNISEKIGVKSYFFFMGGGTSKFDENYDIQSKFIQGLVDKIKKRGHFIGIHPSYNAYNDPIQFKKEKEKLEQKLNTKISFGREHYLRFEVPTTWQIWEDNSMDWDSTLSYADREGFRCGVCYEYSVFNILTRKKLKLKEKPLIVMEGSFVTYQPDIAPKEMENKIKTLITRVKKYNGNFVFLWHNSSFNTPLWKKYQNIYEGVLK